MSQDLDQGQEQNAKQLTATTAINRIMRILEKFPKEKAEAILAFCAAQMK